MIRDILHRLADRFPSHVLVWPVLVQGDGAAAQVAAAVRGFGAMPVAERPDLLIVARGGGSIEDLWAFNEEPVVRAIAESVIPVISAVGHETDTTLADFAADRRAPTPTAAAEMAVPVRADLLAGLGELGLRATRAVNRAQGLCRERLEARAQRLPKLQDLLSPQQQRADDLGERLRAALGLQLAHARGALGRLSGALRPAVLDARVGLARERLARLRLDPLVLDRITTRAGERLAGLERVLAQLDPDAPLQRGYARVESGDGRTLLDRAAAAGEPKLVLHFRDGVLDVVPTDAAPGGPVTPPARTPAPRSRSTPAEPRQSSLF